MDWMKRFSRRSFWWILFWNTLLCAGLYTAAWFALDGIIQLCTNVMVSQPGEMPVMRLSAFIGELEAMRIFGALGVFGLSLLVSILLWLCIGRSLKRMAQPQAPEKEKKEEKQAPQKSAREIALDDQRRVLHLFSMLQREGRLMDFFAEDLSLYEDEQIGAAARGVQESCKKLMEKHLKPSPVIDMEEGETVTVEEGFDPSTIKLTGAVSGHPPFKGVLRHKGWRAAKFDMPTLVKQGDSRIIAPAEVEIE